MDKFVERREHKDKKKGKKSKQRHTMFRNSKEMYQSKINSVNFGNCNNGDFIVYNLDLMKALEYQEDYLQLKFVTKKTGIVNMKHWSESDKENNQDPPMLEDKAIQVQEDTNNNETKYPLWNTREIVPNLEEDVPIFISTKVFRGTQTEKRMFMKHKTTFHYEEKFSHSSISSQNHKTYATVVQDTTKLDKPLYEPDVILPEQKTYLMVKETRRNRVQNFAEKFKKSSSQAFLNSTEKPSTEEDLDVFNFKELVQSLMRTNEKVMVSKNKSRNSLSKPKTTRDFAPSGNKRKMYSKLLLYPSYLKECKKKSQKYPLDPYYSIQQVISRYNAEIIATEALNERTAYNIVYELWGKKKPRMPYTKMFTKSGFD